MTRWAYAATAAVLASAALTIHADDLDRPPINYYATTPTKNVVAELQTRMSDSKATLKFAGEHGYLESVLKELNVPVSSQVLVFTKTSLQRDKISPRLPRAIYFNDDVYVGFVRVGEVLELSTADTELGNVFYTMRQEPVKRPKFERQSEHCLTCHTSRSAGVPANLIRSVFPDRNGNPILSAGSHRVDQSTPIDKRWGGWYVTGTHGKQTHLGNLILPRHQVPEEIPPGDRMNVDDLSVKFDTGAYLSPHSDVVALMVLDHQSEMHNRIAIANYQTKYAVRDADVMNELDGKPKGGLTESTSRRIDSAAEQVLQYMLFCEEAPLKEEIRGNTKFAEEFRTLGPRDSKGRSLRDFDLTTRLLKHPCSYLIYSNAFEGLPPVVKDRIYKRLADILHGRDTSKAYAHLTPADRKAILEILRETKRDLPKGF
jgi:hypothetical protein